MLGCAFLAYLVSATLMHSYAVFLVAFVGDFGWTRNESSLPYSVSQLVAGISAPLVGLMVDRLGPRLVMLMGGALLTLGLIGSAFATALWQVVLLYGVAMTLGAVCLSMLVFVPLMSKLFAGQRGRAMALMQSANGLGRAVAVPVGQLLVSGIGWRMAYLVEAAVMALLVIPLAALFSRRRVEAVHAAVTPEAAPRDGTPPPAPARNWKLAEAMRTREFWLLFFVYMCTSIGSFLVMLHQLAFAVDAGFDPLYAAAVFGTGAFLALPGVIITGIAADRIGREAAAVIAYGVSIVGVACALFIDGPDQHFFLWLHACLFGVTWGARGPAVMAKTADLFTGPSLGTIVGVITIGSGIGAALGSWGAGWIFDNFGSYRLAFILSIVAYSCGAVAFWALRRPRGGMGIVG